MRIKRSQWLLIGLGMAGAFIFGLLNPDPAPRGNFLLQLVGAFMLTVAIHELGHVVAGWLVGFRLVHVSVGPILVSHYTERFNFHWWLIRSRAMGFASMVPPPGSGQYWRMAVVIAGGPTASGICAYCFSRLQSRISESSPLNGFAGIVALTSLVIGVIMSAIPARAGPLRTDGALLLSLFRGGVDAKLFMVHTRVLGMHIHGVRALDWGAASVALLEPSASAQSLALTSALILYEWNLDRGESAVAGEWIDRARLTPEAQDRFGRGNVLAESAYFEAFYRHNPQARLWLEEAGSDWTLPRFVRLRAEAAVLLSEGRRIEATEACDQALATLRREFPSGRLPATEQDWILEIRARAIDSA